LFVWNKTLFVAPRTLFGELLIGSLFDSPRANQPGNTQEQQKQQQRFAVSDGFERDDDLHRK
jgi:hypothetical protein